MDWWNANTVTKRLSTDTIMLWTTDKSVLELQKHVILMLFGNFFPKKNIQYTETSPPVPFHMTQVIALVRNKPFWACFSKNFIVEIHLLWDLSCHIRMRFTPHSPHLKCIWLMKRRSEHFAFWFLLVHVSLDLTIWKLFCVKEQKLLDNRSCHKDVQFY